MPTSLPFASVFAELQEGPLSADSVRSSFDAMLSGAWSPVQIGAFLAALRIRGESAETITAAVGAMRSMMVPVATSATVILDTCGTGGDRSGSINLSTASAIICAADGITVAKHGNRAVSSQAGSADVLSTLGIPIEVAPDISVKLLERVNIAFLLAPVHHPAMRHVMPVRRDLGVRTLFNCLGPIANPAGATHQLIGAFSDELRPMLAETLRSLGTRRAWVVRGEDGMDEVSPYGATRVTELSNGRLSEHTVTPDTFGLTASKPDAARGGNAADNARIIESILSGEAHPARDAVVLNAAAALVVARDLEPKEATTRVERLIDQGLAKQKLEDWRAVAKELTRAG